MLQLLLFVLIPFTRAIYTRVVAYGDIDENIAMIQHDFDAVNDFQTTMQVIYKSYMDTKIKQYIELFESAIRTILADGYSTIQTGIKQQIMGNINSSLIQLQDSRDSLDGAEMEDIMTKYYDSKQKAINDFSRNNDILSHDGVAQISKLVQNIEADGLTIAFKMYELIKTVRLPSSPPRTYHQLWILPHAVPYIDEIKNELLESNILFDDTMTTSMTITDFMKDNAWLFWDDPLTTFLPYNVYIRQLNQFFDEIADRQQGSDDSLQVIRLSINVNTVDTFGFKQTVIGPLFIGDYVTELSDDSINAKCMKWWRQDVDATFGEKQDNYNIGCVLASTEKY